MQRSLSCRRALLALLISSLSSSAAAQSPPLIIDDTPCRATEQAPAFRTQEATGSAARATRHRVGVANLPIDGATRLNLTSDFTHALAKTNIDVTVHKSAGGQHGH